MLLAKGVLVDIKAVPPIIFPYVELSIRLDDCAVNNTVLSIAVNGVYSGPAYKAVPTISLTSDM